MLQEQVLQVQSYPVRGDRFSTEEWAAEMFSRVVPVLSERVMEILSGQPFRLDPFRKRKLEEHGFKFR